MTITKKTKVVELINSEPYVLHTLMEYNKGFSKLENSLFRNTIGQVADIETASSFMGLDPDEVLKIIRQAVLGDIIKALHTGAEFSLVRQRFIDLIQDLAPGEISRMEQMLIENGMPETEVRRLCDVHVEVFKPALDQKPELEIPVGHALEIFALENEAILEICDRLEDLAEQTIPEGGLEPDLDRFLWISRDAGRIGQWLDKSILHYVRKENQLFPALEAHGVTGPTQVMWGVDDDIRSQIKNYKELLIARDAKAWHSATSALIKIMRDMIYKEEKILFPMAFEVLTAEDWKLVASGESALGYGLVQAKTPATDAKENALTPEGQIPSPATYDETKIPFQTGYLSLEQAQLIFKNLPVDISFVDSNDTVIFYSDNADRVFPRTPTVIGRKVQFCHPPKSMHLVQQILDDFRSGVRAHAEFWINLGGRFIHIQYMALRSSDGTYQGCMESTQDLTRLRALEGEKRLLA